MRKTSLLFILAATALASATAHAGPVLERIKSTGKLVIAHRESSVPFSYLDEHKKPVGYAVDLCLRVAEVVKKKLGLPKLAIEYVPITSANRIEFIVAGRADMECGSTTNTAERRQKVAFTVPHYITGARYLVRAHSPIAELAHFEGKRLVSTAGSSVFKALDYANRERLLRINLVEAPDLGKAIQMVEEGQAEGFAMDEVLLYGLIFSRPDPGKFKVVGKFISIDTLGIMLSKDDPEFKRIVNDEMKRLITSHEAHALYDRWFMQPIPPQNRPLNLPMNYLLKDFWKYPTDQVPG